MKTVLVAEDEPAILEMLVAVLEDEGYRVLAAGDGVAALELLAGETPDLVLTDAMMPRLDGLALVARMRAERRTAGVPVVVLSAVLRGEPDGFEGSRSCPSRSTSTHCSRPSPRTSAASRRIPARPAPRAPPPPPAPGG